MTDKLSPGVDPGPPDDGRFAVLGALEIPEARASLRIALTVSGGLPDDRYELQFESNGRGEGSCGVGTARSRGEMAKQAFRLSDGEAQRLLERMGLAALVKADFAMPLIPPDSLVGRLEVSAGGQPLTIYFMADPEQARTAGHPPPAEVLKAVTAIYGVCEANLGNRWQAPT